LPRWVKDAASKPAMALFADFVGPKNRFFLDPVPSSEAIVRNRKWVNTTKFGITAELRQLTQDPSLVPTFQDVTESLRRDNQFEFRAILQRRT
jgi:hypothetical protein